MNSNRYGHQLWATAWMIVFAVGCSSKHRQVADQNESDVALTAPRSTAAAARGPIFFSTVSDSGIEFQHVSGNSAEKPFPAANGSGIAALDFDLDGFYDLYFASGSPFPIDASQNQAPDRIYRNAGNWRFEDVTSECRLGHNGYSAGLAVGDFDADGFPDLYVACFGENCLFRNQGDGTFEKLAEAGVADARWATSCAFLDCDNDGLLDLYVCNYAKWNYESRQFCGDRSRNVRIFCSPISVEPEQDVLFRNQGDGTFQDWSQQAGLANRAARGQGVVAADIDGDHRIDLYVGNDLNSNSLFLNDGSGRFHDATDTSGTGFDHRGSPQAGMGVDAADVDRDGDVDLLVTNFSDEHNALYLNQGHGDFQDMSHERGLAAAGMRWIGWGTALADLDLDGWCDVFVTNGHVDDNLHLLGKEDPYAQPPLVWRNVDGRFEDVSQTCGEYFLDSHCGRALSIVDLDNDGDWDVVVGHQDAAPALLRNERFAAASQSAKWLRLKLVGTASNRDAVGAKIIETSNGPCSNLQVKGGGSYLSANDLRQILVAEPQASSIELSIQWPSGKVSRLSGLDFKQTYLVVESRESADMVSVIRN